MYIQCMSWPRRQGVGRACATEFRDSKDMVFPRCRTPLPMRPGRRSQPSQRSPHPKSAGHALLSLPRNLGVEDLAPGCNFTTWKRKNVAGDIAISTLVTLLCKIHSNINTQQYSAHVHNTCAQSACGSEMQKLLADHADHSDVATSLRARTAARYVSPGGRSPGHPIPTFRRSRVPHLTAGYA